MSTFSPVGSAKLTTTPSGAANPAITNLALTANTEASFSLPANTRQYLVKLREATASLQISFVSGDTNVTYLTVPKGNYYADSGLLAGPLTVYCRTPSSGQVLEILIWT